MKKWTKIACYLIIVSLAVVLYVQYQSNNKTIDALGSMYLSNIENFEQHVNHVQTYLQNEKEFKESDLLNYYYEVNYLLTLRLPSEYSSKQYISVIQSGISEIQSLVSNKAKNEDIEVVRKRTLELLIALKGGLDKMSTAGRVKVGNGFQEDYKKYYQLSLSNNKTMLLINNGLQKQLQEHLDILNKNQ